MLEFLLIGVGHRPEDLTVRRGFQLRSRLLGRFAEDLAGIHAPIGANNYPSIARISGATAW